MLRVAFHNLGCKVNAYETERMIQSFSDAGYEIVDFEEEADIYIVNTCTVTNIADRKSRQMLHRAKTMNPRALVVACGCYVETRGSGKTPQEIDQGERTIFSETGTQRSREKTISEMGVEPSGEKTISETRAVRSEFAEQAAGGGRSERAWTADLLIGNKEKKDIVKIVEEYIENTQYINCEIESFLAAKNKNKEGITRQFERNASNETVPEKPEETSGKLRELHDHTRAYVKIQDGCDQFCSYCVIPIARGRIHSRRPEEIREEITALSENGIKEVVLTGIHLSSYGIDLNAYCDTKSQRSVNLKIGNSQVSDGSVTTSLSAQLPWADTAARAAYALEEPWLLDIGTSSVRRSQVCERLTGQLPAFSYNRQAAGGEFVNREFIRVIEETAEIEGIRRIRLGSLEPRIITKELLSAIKENPKVCPHFHLSLQSGCDEVLRRMNRHYTTEEYEERIEMIRSVFEHPAITTDVIAGFPGESESEFLRTREFLNRIDFYETHIFKYSRRRGTVADKMPGQLTEREKAERAELLAKDDKERRERFREYYYNKEVEVLLEEEKIIDGERYFVGFNREYVKLALRSGEDLTNRIVTGRAGDMVLSQQLLVFYR
ncbi:MAG: radical SAM protein [Lachnospiraceae bacterium]|nr:radical SAM protein [Lachnospiraceae bacterium]